MKRTRKHAAQVLTGFVQTDHRHWPPGSIMQFDNYECSTNKSFFRVSGLVVFNHADKIGVLWGAGAREPFMIYEVKHLNDKVISRVK